MGLSQEEVLVLEYLSKNEKVKVIPDEIKDRITPETLRFTLAQLQAKGLVEYMKGEYAPTEKAQELFKKKKTIRDEIIAEGHPDITASSEVSIKLTKNDEPNGDDCIGVKANKSCEELNEELKNYLKFGRKVKVTISVDELKDVINAFGSPALELRDENEISITKTDSIDKKTVVILADKAAVDLKEELREKLKNDKTKIKIVLEIE